MPRELVNKLICLLALGLGSVALCAATSAPERFQMNHDIHIEAGDKTGEVTCMHCSIYVRGQVSGDVTAIAGNVVLYQGSMVAGDVTAVLGDVRVENGSQAAGDLTAVGGTVRRDPQATVAGDVTALSGGGWILLIFLPPLLILGAIIALIIWLVQRQRRQAPVPAAARH